MNKKNKVTGSSVSLNLYAPPNPVKNRHRFLPEDKYIKIQKVDNNSYLTKQIFHAVQHGYLEVLQSIPKKLMKSCLQIHDEGTLYSLLHYAVLENHIDVVLYLLTFKPDINILASKKLRPIHLAAQKGHIDLIELLCSQKKIQIDASDDKGQTPLHIACRRGYHEVVKILLKYGASVYKVETDKVSVMHHPVRRNDIEMINTLFSFNAPLTIKNNNGQNPLMIAAIEGHCDLFLLLLEKIQENNFNTEEILNEKDNDGNSCLSYSVQNKHSEILKICLKFGANVDTKQIDGKTIFHSAAIIGYERLFEIIEVENINLNVTDNELNTPLHEAILHNSLNMVMILMKHGANVNICNRKFQTPILLACSEISAIKNFTDIIKFLINAKADLRIRDGRMKTVFHHVVEKQEIEILKYMIRNIPTALRQELINSQDIANNSPLHLASKLGNTEMCKVLLTAGADPKMFAENDYLPLHVATINGHLEVVKMLLEFDVNTGNYRDTNESAATHLAAEEGKYEIFKFLIENGNDYLAKDEFGRNTLMFAARSGCLPIVEYLLKHEININLWDQMKTTALHQAAGEGHVKVVECLWKHGAVLSDNIYNQSPLDVAVVNQHVDVVRFFLNKYNWKQVMAYRHKNGASHIENLIRYCEDITMELFDKCITESTTNKLDPNYEIKYWFGIIDAGPDDPSSISERYYALQSMAKYKRLKLLRHPLSDKLLERKWKVYGYGFYVIDLLLYILFVICISTYVLNASLITDNALVDKNTGCKITASNLTRSRDQAPPAVMFSNSLTVTCLMIRLALQVLKLLSQKLKFFISGWNLVCNFCIGMGICFLSNPFSMPCLPEWILCVPLMFATYFMSLYYIQHMPMIGIQIIMFQKVLGTMIKVLISFSCVFIGFAFGFYIMNSDQDTFQNPGIALIKVIGMMIGEIDLVTYFISGRKNYYLISILMIAIFLIVIPITLFNLIIGLAVGDIDVVASEATLEAFKLKIEFVWEVESKFPVFIQRFMYTDQIDNRIRKKKMSGFKVDNILDILPN